MDNTTKKGMEDLIKKIVEDINSRPPRTITLCGATVDIPPFTIEETELLTVSLDGKEYFIPFTTK